MAKELVSLDFLKFRWEIMHTASVLENSYDLNSVGLSRSSDGLDLVACYMSQAFPKQTEEFINYSDLLENLGINPSEYAKIEKKFYAGPEARKNILDNVYSVKNNEVKSSTTKENDKCFIANDIAYYIEKLDSHKIHSKEEKNFLAKRLCLARFLAYVELLSLPIAARKTLNILSKIATKKLVPARELAISSFERSPAQSSYEQEALLAKIDSTVSIANRCLMKIECLRHKILSCEKHSFDLKEKLLYQKTKLALVLLEVPLRHSRYNTIFKSVNDSYSEVTALKRKFNQSNKETDEFDRLTFNRLLNELSEDNESVIDNQIFLNLAFEKYNNARQNMMLTVGRLVMSIAKKYVGLGLSYTDLIQHGNIGAMEAADKFSFRSGNQFTTYAPYHIRKAIRVGLTYESKEFRCPLYFRETVTSVSRYIKDFSIDNKREPSIWEISSGLDLNTDKVKQALSFIKEPVNLNDEVEGTQLYNIFDDDSLVVKERFDFQMDIQVILGNLDKLNDNQRYVITYRFGLENKDTKTLEAIGRDLGVTRERVRQIEAEALKKLYFLSLNQLV